MGKRKSDQPTTAPDQASSAQNAAGSAPATLTPPAAAASPVPQPVKSEAPEAAASAAPAPAEATPLPPAPFVVASSAAKVEAPKMDAPQADAGEPPVAPAKPIVLYRLTPHEEAAAADDAAAETIDATATGEQTSRSWRKIRRIMPLAASIVIAVAVGAMAGSATSASLGNLWASVAAPAKPSEIKSADLKAADLRPLRDTITRLNAEVAALKASVDNSSRTANVQLTKLGDRLDRVEHAQAEPAARLAKLAEAVDRIEHRAPSGANDVTGSIPAPATSPETQPATAPPVKPAGPTILEGWFVRGVYHGAALIQTRYGSVLEVERGDNLPGLGRIENIHRQDGRWVVVTSRGMILAR